VLFRSDQLDTALKTLARTDPGVHLFPWDNQKALTAAQRAASLHIGGQDVHDIHITPRRRN